MGQTRIRDSIGEMARQMARSGRFCSWRLIAIELRFIQGLREATDCFSDQAFRDELDSLCRTAQRAAPKYRPAPQPEANKPAFLGAPVARPPETDTPSPFPRRAPERVAAPAVMPTSVPSVPRAAIPPAPTVTPKTLRLETAFAAAPRFVPKYRT